jgi:phage portal protein BeeE
MLYQDTLGPWLGEFQDEVKLQLVKDYGDAKVYVEFNMMEKLRGSFEEQAKSLQTAVGGPWLTRNEARARQNLSPIDGGDELIVPLNVTAGEPAPAPTPEPVTPPAEQPAIEATASS